MFQVQSLPAVAAILKGQPAPLFVGDQEPTVIAQIVDKVISLAVSNGLTGVAVVDENAEAPKQELPPRVQAAYNAVDAGDFAKAVVEFEAALAESPANKLAITGLAQAKFLVRSQNIEMETVLTKPAESLQDVLDKSDALMGMGHFDKAFAAVLDTFAVAHKEDREILRTHLLELFKVAGEADPLVTAARARLASLLD
jgi:putative thioredoxin